MPRKQRDSILQAVREGTKAKAAPPEIVERVVAVAATDLDQGKSVAYMEDHITIVTARAGLGAIELSRIAA